MMHSTLITTFILAIATQLYGTEIKPLSIDIAVPEIGGVTDKAPRWIAIYSYDKNFPPEFSVVITNQSNQDQFIYAEDLHRALTFDLTDKDGKKWTATDQYADLDLNGSWRGTKLILKPGEYFVIIIYLEFWNGFPKPKNSMDETVTMRAVFNKGTHGGGTQPSDIFESSSKEYLFWNPTH